ncbi:MAG: peptidoglycan bridge formation glycyltransferase FemA/FemB family protein [Chloroflexi bacterium]|nr:peptidoglycan bridge formation glycyltransferase FemA/FemB family protein [Chloroflexota bacterium]
MGTSRGAWTVHEATADELADWDAHTVDVPGGDVFQSREYGEYRSRHGWRPHFLAFDDGFRALAISRPWPWIGGGGAYIPRGPVSAGEPAERTADRLRAAADWLAAHRIDVVSADSEVLAESEYPAFLAARGFRQIEEIQVARHRVGVPLGTDEAAQLALIGQTSRNLIRRAERQDVRVLRFDARASEATNDGFEIPDGALQPAGLEAALRGFYVALEVTADRRGFRGLLYNVNTFLDWSMHAITAGLAIYLEVRAPDGRMLAGALFHRHGERLTYGYAADVFELRDEFPGAVRLLIWRGMQIAMREGRREMDLGGVDTPAARRKPVPGEEMHGLLAFKEAFGGKWVEQSGNHEWVARPWRYAAGRVLAAVARRVRR